MTDIFAKCRNFTIARQLMESGIYPYFKELESEQAPEITIKGKKFIMFGSNNYLGLANDPRMKAAAIDAVKNFGTGVAGSRFLNGNTVLHMNLERKLAAFKGREAALVYATGYQMNLGVISALVGKGDFAIVDKLDHASILDGCRLSHGEIRRYKHNNMSDLEKVLKDIGPRHGKLVIVDGVFSMEGDIANLPEMKKLCDEFGALLIVDDSHGTGVMGETGRGTHEYYNMKGSDIDFFTGTLGKALGGAAGGYVAGSKRGIELLIQRGRPTLFSNALPVSVACSANKAIHILMKEPQRVKKLRDNTAYAREGIRAVGFDVLESPTAICPIIVHDTAKAIAMSKRLLELGVFAIGFGYPIVPEGAARIRVQISACHEKQHLDKLINALKQLKKEYSD